ncbi:MAG: hypothetical protein IJT30_00675 [Muribaculaceae bacterium]|nr:hypothetical protein [Muribaculaceae bacterium]
MRRKLSLLLLALLLALPLGGFAQQSVRGDVNGSGVVDIDDVNAVINVMLHKATPADFPAADVNGDGAVDIDDLNVVINVILGKDGGGSQEEGDWVDLGLPSGTLWASRNIGAATPGDRGDYFAWGETSPKARYFWYTYKWYREGYYDAQNGWLSAGFTKYCTNYDSGFDGCFVDNKTELDLADDAAAANWGGGARMPSFEQIKELVDNCTWQWTSRDAGIYVVYGQLATGPNGNSIFLPAAGLRWGGSLYYADIDGFYWSRTLGADDSNDAYYLYFDSGYAYRNYYSRSGGLTVRAVRVP